MVEALRERTSRANILLFDVVDRRQGIVHVIGPELGLTLPGLSIVCGDSHTCTNGAFGAMPWGIGSSELAHVLAPQTLRHKRPGPMSLTLDGLPGTIVSAHALSLPLVVRVGACGGSGVGR